MALGIWLALLPAWLVESLARSAELIDPGSRIARNWRAALVIVMVLTCLPYRPGRCAWRPPAALSLAARAPFLVVPPTEGRGALRPDARRGLVLCRGIAATPLFPPGIGRLSRHPAWLAVPAILIASGGRQPLIGNLGRTCAGDDRSLLALSSGPLRRRGRASALFSRRAIRERFRRAPWAFAFALVVFAGGGGDPALFAQDRDGSTRCRLAAELGLRHLPGAGTTAFGVGVCPFGTPRSAPPLASALDGSTRDRSRGARFTFS